MVEQRDGNAILPPESLFDHTPWLVRGGGGGGFGGGGRRRLGPGAIGGLG